MSHLFINPATPENGGAIPDDGYGFIQVLFLGGCYAFLLLKGSNLISEGSELLLLIPSAAGLVGSVVLPVLGAVPDGCIVLFSGLGPRSEVEEQLKVGVGALAGSTVMLITIPWFLSILGGRVPIIRGEACYNRSRRESISGREIASACQSMVTVGVAANLSSIRASAFVMMITCLLGYLIVEIPALALINDDQETRSKDIGPFAWVGAVLCAVMFFGYLALQFRIANAPSVGGASLESTEAKAVEVARRRIQDGKMSLCGVLSFFLTTEGGHNQDDRTKMEARLRSVIRPFFVRYDKDNSGALSRDELRDLVSDLGERSKREDFDALFSRVDSDRSGTVDFDECVRWLADMALSAPDLQQQTAADAISNSGRPTPRNSNALPLVAVPDIEDGSCNDEQAEGDEEEEGPELPEDVRDMSPADQRKWVLRSSCWQMGLGTLIVLIISDPMVDVLNTLGDRTGISSFYVAFLLAPLASNASEMIASYSYAKQKSQKSITISFAQLLGAACMNNTFCLGIFYMIVAARGLTWSYHAEVCGIIFAELVMVAMATQRVQTIVHAILALSLMPICLVFVYLLKATAFNGKE